MLDYINKVNVLHMTTVDYTIDRMLLDKMSCLKSYSYSISFASSKGRYLEKINNTGFCFYPIEMSRNINLFRDFISVYHAYKYMKKEKPLIVHTHTAKAGFIGRAAARLAKVPVIIHTAHGLPFYKGQSRISYYIYLWLEKLAARISDYVFSQNFEDTDNMKRHKFKPKYGIGYEGNGIDIHKIDKLYRTFDNRKKLDELKITDNSVIIGYYARLEPVKGHMKFLEAFKQVAKKYPNAICLIAGEGFLEDEIRKYIIDYNLIDNVKLIGLREDMHEVISITDIVVLASEKEGIPRILMESMYMKKPVVATNVLGTKELVINNKTGLLVEYGDIGALANAICKLIGDCKLRIDLGMAGHERIKSKFSEEKVAERIHKVYKYLLDKKGIVIDQKSNAKNFSELPA